MSYKPTNIQKQAWTKLGSTAKHVLLVGGSRCVSGDTVIDGQTKTIAELAAIGEPIDVVTSWGVQRAEAPFKKGKCKLLTVTTESKAVTVTPDHRFWNGRAWVKAETLSAGSSLAVRLSEQTPQGSTSELSLRVFLAGARHLMRTLADSTGRCSDGFHRCGQLLRRASASVRACCASLLDELGRSRWGLFHSHLAFESLGSDNRARRSLEHAASDSRCDLSLSRRSSTGGSPLSYPASVLSGRACAQTCAPSQGLSRHTNLQSALQSILRLSFAASVQAVRLEFARFFGFSYDTPLVGCYAMEKVLSVTETAEQDYYTLHVPTTEHYFADGVMHHNSGKTFIALRAVVTRAIAAPDSRHAVLRFRFNHVKASIILDTLPKMMSLCWPGMPYEVDKTDWYMKLPNGSQIWFGGLDDKERTEKILGQEYATIFFNECSQIPLSSRNTAMTRLAQKCTVTGTGTELRLRAIYDENPPSKAHWTYQLFVLKKDPESKRLLSMPDAYDYLYMNPIDNIENLPADYLRELQNMPPRVRQRFLEGKFADTTVGALWTDDLIEKHRHLETTPDLVRIVVAVDPSGSDDTDNINNDEIGIVAAGLGIDGKGYLLEDVTIKAGPATWGNMAVTTYDRHDADLIVGEKNYGGAMVKYVIKSSARAANQSGVKFKEVTASRGKAVRAEPISALCEQGKIKFAGYFPELEEELCGFTTHGYTGENSPNRADAAIWAFSELFPGIVRDKARPKQIIREWAPSDPSMAY